MTRAVEGYRALASSDKGGVAALGNFDGVHRGHLSVLETAAELARSLGCEVVAAVFKPHPRRYFKPDTIPFRLMSDGQRVRALGKHGAVRVHHIPFGPELAAMTPDMFARGVLAEGLGLKGVVTGADFRFGHDRAGDAAMLGELGERYGFTARTADEIDDGGEKISSTAVREAIQAGDVTRARLLMDRPFIVEGVVRRGDQRGRVLGFPTANIAFEDYVRPLPGVYAVRARLPGETQWRAGVANAGKRPTVGGTDERLEVNIFDFEGDLYGLELEVALEAFIRAEKRFDGLDALKAQIGADCETARQILNG
ncbi:riboflavin biosynthesis protein [Marinicauda pacifica]|jgi:riboflavin kinase/FMN adenylyltransferase|uniref:Riboflavin biosynthesis protein n=1 Tax=Marinicauda pacifica TaxID=1133559 RepID=A0A4S2HA43_9PROT|nr:riboflavin biosynthesis protein RibF [Marinicauda pacifica]TGY92785.1 riboflavin biosynthesis protein RibF [Marinicauda pacifica]GGE40361.1 riboflavin biosynthesis protein [Marinicauda pacifica]